jgi:hypothetical protein
VETSLLIVLALYGVAGGVLGAVAAHYAMKAFYAFAPPARFRFAFAALQFGGLFGAAFGGGASVALHSDGPAGVAGVAAAAIATMIAIVCGAPKETGLAIPPDFRQALRDAADNRSL